MLAIGLSGAVQMGHTRVGRFQSGAFLQTPGDCITCLGISSSGLTTGIWITITGRVLAVIPSGQSRSTGVSLVEVAGFGGLMCADPRVAIMHAQICATDLLAFAPLGRPTRVPSHL